jgi:two-component system, OmpR family, sensor histidine kinase SenX3
VTLAAALAGLVVGTGLAIWFLLGRLRAGRRRVEEIELALERDVTRHAASAAVGGRLTLALGGIAHGVVVFDELGDVAYRNEPAAAFLSARHGDLLVEEAITGVARDALDGNETEREIDVFGPPRRILSLRAVPLGERARPVGALVEVEDTSARRRLENVRRDFVANISHELKTPVGALVLLAETLQDEDDPAVMRRLSERMASEAMRVGHTIDDLLELSRLEVAPLHPPEEALPVAGFVEDAADRLRAAADRRSIRLDVEVPDHLVVQGDRRQLVSAVANLLDNAVKYSDPESTIEVRARLARGDWVEVEVRDHGIGIPQHDLERIFERFYRVDRARSRETGGTGLGLAIVRHVVSNHRGEVRVKSREGQGSRFTLRLPAHTAAPGTDDEPASTGETTPNGDSGAPAPGAVDPSAVASRSKAASRHEEAG